MISQTYRHVSTKHRVLLRMWGTTPKFFSSLPPHTVVNMPALSPTMESGSISKWNVKEGDSFSPGTSLCDVETDKATVSFDATEDGIIAKILINSGEIKVGQPLLVTVEDEKFVSSFSTYSHSLEASTINSSQENKTNFTKEKVQEIPRPSSTSNSNSSSSTNKIFASPLARKLAREGSFSLEKALSVLGQTEGSGPRGRLLASDISKASSLMSRADLPLQSASVSSKTSEVISYSKESSAAVYTDFDVSPAALALSSSYSKAKLQIPHYYLSVDLDLTAVINLRERVNSRVTKADKLNSDEAAKSGLSVYDFLVKAAAVSMRTVPDLNASWMESFVRVYEDVDVQLVMGAGGIVSAPVIRNAGNKGLIQLSKEIAQHETSLLTGENNENDGNIGTFSIHNLGAFGVKASAPIVLPPHAAALSLGAIIDTVVPAKKEHDKVNEGDNWSIAPILTATLSCDHRVVDGAVSARWLAAFKEIVEDPINLML